MVQQGSPETKRCSVPLTGDMSYENKLQERETHSGLEGNELEDHLHSENPSENHVEDVHGIVEQMRLTMVLEKDRFGPVKSKGILMHMCRSE